MTSISKNVCINKLADIYNKYSNTYYSTIKMKPVDLKSNTYIDSVKGINDKDPKFKVGGIVRIWKLKNAFAKGYTPNWSEEVFGIKKVKNTVVKTYVYVIKNHNGEEIFGSICVKELPKPNQKEFRIEKLIKRKGDKLYVKSRGYENSLNSWIDKIDSINEWIFSKSKLFRSKCKSWFRFFWLCNINKLKNAGLDAFDLALKTDLANLKSDVDKLDIDRLKNVPSNLSSLKSKVDKLDIGKLETTPVDLSKLSNIVKNDVVKRTEYNKLVKKS